MKVIEHAIKQARRGYQLVLHTAHTAFHHAYWEIVRPNYPDLVMRPVKGRGAGSIWVVLKGRNFPKHDVQIDHKLTDGIVGVVSSKGNLRTPRRRAATRLAVEMFLFDQFQSIVSAH
ncbi:hypothetical protein [Caballeronia sp. dw_19]|uniref:hypothetical protein n=1 Tax=Caballeronia sp. dw_19 TaxID=2719791 RepID=UPI001BD37BDC|nr:hypothetical protein [Caballeronia sp. dw_19]